MRHNLLICIVGLLLAEHTICRAQTSQALLNRASQLIRGGQWNEAALILNPLYQQHPDDYRIYRKLKQVYFGKQDYPAALNHIRTFLNRHPKFIREEADLGRVLYLTGQEKEAWNTWRALIRRSPKDKQVYHQVAHSLIAMQMTEEAIEIYHDGQSALKNDRAFASQLASLHESLKQYDASTRMVLFLVIHNQKYENSAHRRLNRYPKSQAVQTGITRVMESVVRDHPDVPALKRLLGRQYVRAGRFEDAFALIRELESASRQKTRGQTMYQFAHDAFAAGYYGVAEQAFQEILADYPDFKKKDDVRLNLARTLVMQQKHAEAVAIYDAVIRGSRQSFAELNALYAKAVLLRDSLRMTDKAADIFSEIQRRYPETKEGRRTDYETGHCFLIERNYNEAARSWKKSRHLHADNKNAVWLLSSFQLARVKAAMGNFSFALAVLDSLKFLRTNPELMAHPQLNDALQLQQFLQSHANADSLALRRMILAQTGFDLHDFSSVLMLLDSVRAADDREQFRDEIFYLQARTWTGMQHYRKALAAYDSLKMAHPSSAYLPDACLQSGILLEKQGKTKEALHQYEAVLMTYPHSLAVHEARRRIRAMETKE